jgi:5-methylcytosine-specific restriction protein A
VYLPVQQRVRRRDDRPSASKRGYGYRWGVFRAVYLRNNPVCADPFRLHRIPVPATVVDHIVPHRGDPELFWKEDNLQPLCASCHSRKTLMESQ